jgi:two-component system cell cycle sensor histidine kinase/response regulator CckA
MVRSLSERTLRSHGYNVLAAPHGAAALELMERHTGPIQLLLTDVVMPQMSGRELAEAVSRRHPGIRILYMSGYTEDTIVHHGMLDNAVSLLQKPFTPTSMARRVREVLDAAAP